MSSISYPHPGTDVTPTEPYSPNRHYHERGITPHITGPYSEKEGVSHIEIADEYGFHAALVPWPAREWDTVDVMTRIGEYVTDLPDYKATVTYKELADLFVEGSRLEAPRFLHPIVGVFGLWEYTAGAKNGTRWVNPRYRHIRSDAVDADYADLSVETEGAVPQPPADQWVVAARAEWVRWGLSVGLNMDVIAARFGCSRSTLYEFASARGWPLEEWRQEGAATLARTAKTMHEWGATWPEVAGAFGVDRGTPRDWVDAHAADYRPPSRYEPDRRAKQYRREGGLHR